MLKLKIIKNNNHYIKKIKAIYYLNIATKIKNKSQTYKFLPINL
jgi:hypothetical protein